MAAKKKTKKATKKTPAKKATKKAPAKKAPAKKKTPPKKPAAKKKSPPKQPATPEPTAEVGYTGQRLLHDGERFIASFINLNGEEEQVVLDAKFKSEALFEAAGAMDCDESEIADETDVSGETLAPSDYTDVAVHGNPEDGYSFSYFYADMDHTMQLDDVTTLEAARKEAAAYCDISERDVDVSDAK